MFQNTIGDLIKYVEGNIFSPNLGSLKRKDDKITHRACTHDVKVCTKRNY